MANYGIPRSKKSQRKLLASHIRKQRKSGSMGVYQSANRLAGILKTRGTKSAKNFLNRHGSI